MKGKTRSVFTAIAFSIIIFVLAATNGQRVTLRSGQTVTVTSNPVTGTMTISGVSPLGAQTFQQIESLAQQVAAAIPAIQAFEGVPK